MHSLFMRLCTPQLPLILAVAGCLAGCQDYYARRDALTLHSGDAVAWNKAVHVVDPWPAASADTNIPVNGRRVAIAIEKYENRGASGEAGAGAAMTPVSMVPVMPAPAAK